MKVVSRVEDVINPSIVERGGSIICTAGADVTSQVLLRSLAADPVNLLQKMALSTRKALILPNMRFPYRISPLRNTGKKTSQILLRKQGVS